MGVLTDFISSVVGRRSRPAMRAARVGADFDEAALVEAVALLDAAKASDVLAQGSALAAGCLTDGDDRRHVADVAMQARPDAAWILSMDRNGHIRAAALQRLTSPAGTAGRFTVVALRLNDWAPEVRSQAVPAARRIWNATPPDIVAQAAPYLLAQRFLWKRWAAGEATCVDEVLSRPDVAERLTSRLRCEESGPLGRTLVQALRLPIYEAGLPELATTARLPTVRAVAVRSLLAGRVNWPTGLGWVWVDKSTGRRRRVVVSDGRAIVTPRPRNLVQDALADRSALVRKIVADHIIENMRGFPHVEAVAEQLSRDRSPAVRDRADYLIRHLG